jgi:NADPH:quinone reductase-like Zn-dependent oxidoreductase
MSLPTKMRAIQRKDGVYDKDFSKMFVLGTDLPVPPMKANQVLVKVITCASNPVDCKM